MARVPRVSGSGSHRTGQGAFANSCRKGHMAFPLRTYRRWHRKVNLRQRRVALAAALAATQVPALVMARGHRIMAVPQLPLVLDDSVGQISKTKEAVAMLKRFGAYEDVVRCIKARTLRPGVGKSRNRRYKLRRGPLFIVGDESESLKQALRNIPGIAILHVNRLNIRHLAPGGQVGRFCIYTQSAFKALQEQFGSLKAPGKGRTHFLLPKSVTTSCDVAAIINSDEVQKVLRQKKTKKTMHMIQKKNPLKNKKEMARLNPFAPKAKALTMEKRKNRIKKQRKDRKSLTKSNGLLINKMLQKIENTQVEHIDSYKQYMKEVRI
jgi:large subunit ribosomal protein L4e